MKKTLMHTEILFFFQHFILDLENLYFTEKLINFENSSNFSNDRKTSKMKIFTSFLSSKLMEFFRALSFYNSAVRSCCNSEIFRGAAAAACLKILIFFQF